MKVGTLVRWRSTPGDRDDFSDLGIVVYIPEADYADEYYVIRWLAGEPTDHTPQMIEECLALDRLEIIQ